MLRCLLCVIFRRRCVYLKNKTLVISKLNDNKVLTFTFMWVFNVLDWENAFPHVTHTYGRSPEWTRMCRNKIVFTVKPLPHWLQTYGLSPVWLRMWYFNFITVVNLRYQLNWISTNTELSNAVYLFWHTEHSIGFSVPCNRLWLVRSPDCRNALPQKSHTNGRSLVWVRMWIFKLAFET